MFGFSFWKLIVLAAILIGVWQIFRIVQPKPSGTRRDTVTPGVTPGAGPGAGPEASRRSAGTAAKAEDPSIRAVETTACSRCGAYQPIDSATACGRDDCPFAP